jgi:hypothetical protein
VTVEKVQTEGFRTRDREVLNIYTACIFGDTRAGHVYALASGAIDFGHNKDQELNRSSTYVDDGSLYDYVDCIETSLEEYLDWIKLLYGEQANSKKKVTPRSQDLVAIGWHWNLREGIWNVGPKRRGLYKMYIAVFYVGK